MTSQIVRTLAFQPNERNIFFHILTACNLSCRHCYINPAQHGSATLDKETIADWLALFAGQDKDSNVIFLGGEPTLHPDLPFAVKTARRLGYRTITVDTNGYLHHDLLNKIGPEEAVLSFSLDGPEAAVNDPLRGSGVFDVCTANIRRAAAMGFETSLIYTVTSLAIAALQRMPALVKSLGISNFFIQIIGLRGNSAGEDGTGLQLSPEDWLTQVPPVAAEAAALGLHVVYPKVFLDDNEPFVCAGEAAENFFIFPNGRVYRCPLCEDFPVHSFEITADNRLRPNSGLREEQFFSLRIPEGCVMNKMLQPSNISYDSEGRPRYRISCCLLKQEIMSSMV